MTSAAFLLASVFWVLSPILFVIGRLAGVWNFHRDILIFSVLMILHFIVLFIHIGIQIYHDRKDRFDEAYIKSLIQKCLTERIRR